MQNRGVPVRQGNRQLKEVLLKYAGTITNFPLASLLIFMFIEFTKGFALVFSEYWVCFNMTGSTAKSDSCQQLLLVGGRVEGKERRGTCHAESEVPEHPSVPPLCALVYSPQSTAVWFA